MVLSSSVFGAEIALGGALLAPFMSSRIARAELAAAPRLVQLASRALGAPDGSLGPIQDGNGLAEDVWLSGALFWTGAERRSRARSDDGTEDEDETRRRRVRHRRGEAVRRPRGQRWARPARREPASHGGADTGPTRWGWLSGLGACTAITLRMYAERKQWPLVGVEVDLSYLAPDRSTRWIDRTITLHGPLDDGQCAKLAEIAEKTP